MQINEKFTDTTWPAAPEKATLEGKNKFLGFWFFLGGETVLICFTICYLSCIKG